MYRRIITPALQAALGDSPVVLLNGARQTGKTTLVQSLEDARTYLTFDEIGVLSAAKDDPSGFLDGLSGPVTLDEIQHVPELFPALKAAVDRKRTPGRFLLTGSANILLLPRLSESLAGRMEILTLWPLAQAEIEGKFEDNLIDLLFRDDFKFGPLPEVSRADLMRRVLLGGYPEPITRTSEGRRRAWFGSYLTTILQRDVRDMANIEGLTALPRLLSLLAARSGTLLNLADISRTSGLAYTTLTRYMTLLEATFLVQMLPAWSANFAKRLVKSPKILLCDTGLAASQLGLTAERLAGDGSLFGLLLETFAAMELRKAAGGSTEAIQIFHSRTQSGEEVDILLEDGAGRLVGVEVKASASVTASDFRGLRGMAEAVGERFIRGLVLYTGSQVIPFGERLHAVPFSLLWH
jgi:predicted AAA+ superfamily ATPase